MTQNFTTLPANMPDKWAVKIEKQSKKTSALINEIASKLPDYESQSIKYAYKEAQGHEPFLLSPTFSGSKKPDWGFSIINNKVSSWQKRGYTIYTITELKELLK
jgi:hypothetical protein